MDHPARKACLLALHQTTLPDGEMCVPFAVIQDETKLDKAVVRDSVQWLSHYGLAEFYNGLVTDEGLLAGSGYCISQSGKISVDLLTNEKGD